MLTSYNGTAITYDAIGNPLNYRSKSLTWEGRKLSTLTSGSSTYSYKYDESGIRTQKTLTYSGMIGDSRTYYVSDGSKILYEYQQNYPSYTTTNQKYYYYDDNGYLIGFRYNSVDYYYGRNVQGDIIRIYDSTGTVIVYYSYDAWGNILTMTGSLSSTVGTANPFRYRGYYYDSETGFYYLQSRYYDPQVGRFINADGIIGANGDIVGYNLFAYCSNNPVMYVDPMGMFVLETITLITFAKAAAATIAVIGTAIIANNIVKDIKSSPFIPSRNQQILIIEIIDNVIAKPDYSAIFKRNPKVKEKAIDKADTKIKSTVKQTSKDRYWTATLKSDYVDIGRALTYSQAVKEVAAGRNIFTVTRYEAEAVAREAGGTTGANNKPLPQEVHEGGNKGYYWHYHTYNRKGGHVYYLF